MREENKFTWQKTKIDKINERMLTPVVRSGKLVVKKNAVHV